MYENQDKQLFDSTRCFNKKSGEVSIPLRSVAGFTQKYGGLFFIVCKGEQVV